MAKQLGLFLFLLALFSCHEEKNPKNQNLYSPIISEAKGYTLSSDSLEEPQIIKAGIPIICKAGRPQVTPIEPDQGETGGFSIMQSFTTENGLALDAIPFGNKSSICDRAGNLWFCTAGGGVSRYDGKSFTNFTTANGLVNNFVMSVLEDKSGNFWFGTFGGGVSKYDGISFTSYTTSDGLANNSVFSILEDKSGNIWFGTNGGGVSKFNGKSFTNLTTANGLAGNVVSAIAEDTRGYLWFGTHDNGVSLFDGKSFSTYSAAQGLVDDNVQTITEDKTGILWFGTSGGVSRYDGKSFTNVTTSEGLANNYVLSIIEDKGGNLWFGTSGGGVSRYDGKSFTNFTTANGLTNNFVMSIVEDKTGNLWFGTDGGGVNKYDGKSFANFTTGQGLTNNAVISILEDKRRNLWFGTSGGGVCKYNGKSFTSFTNKQGLANNIVYSITEDKTGNLWFGTDGGGVIKYDGKSFVNFTTDQGLANNYVMYILEDKKGDLWFCTYGNGVSKYDGISFTNFTTAQGLAHNAVSSMTEDKAGNLWFGTDGGGVSKYDGKSFTNFNTSQGLANNVILCITEDEAGNLWFGTSGGGVSRYDGKSFTNFTTTEGLPDNNAAQIVIDSQQRIIIGTNIGIAVITGWKDKNGKVSPVGRFPDRASNEELHNYTPVLEIYNSSSGYPVKDVNSGQNAMFKDSNGILWIGTGSDKTGLVRFDYSALNKNKNPPGVVIQSVKINNEIISWYNLKNPGHENTDSTSLSPNVSEEVLLFGRALNNAERNIMSQKFGDIKFDGITKFYPLPENLVLPYQHNNITFDYAAIEPAKPSLVRYQCMLEGYDNGWSPITNKTSATFGNIDEGTYTFKLKARSPIGIWSEPITYTFKVLPPWWRNWWAYLIYAITTLTIIYLVFRWRIAALKQRQRFLEATVEERTAEVVAQKNEVERQKERSENLLLNILPEEVAEELKQKGSAEAKHFDEVTVMFTDFKGFTQISEKLSPSELVAEIHTCFIAFDNIITKYNIEKIKTIGDSYMCAGGLPVINKTNATDIVNAALEIQQFMKEHLQQRVNEGKEPFEIRIGINTGPVVAGIVGVKKFAYDIWGNTVNIASRMESSGETGKVNISESTYDLVKAKFKCTYRGKIEAKNKGEIDMYFVEGLLS
jgi:ligand-binding sensor domain-containing protein/class 3 adenylate cyclase